MSRLQCIALLVALLLLNSCSLLRQFSERSTSKSTAAIGDTMLNTQPVRRFMLFPQPDSVGLAADAEHIKKDISYQVDPIWKTRLQYATMSMKAKVRFETADDQKEFTAIVRMRKDSLVWIDISALGGIVHAARAIVRDDSILMINYLQKEVIKISVSDATKLLPTPVDLPLLQRLISGDPLRDGTLTEVTELMDGYLLGVVDSAFRQSLVYNKLDSCMVSDDIRTISTDAIRVLINATDYQSLAGQKVSAERKIRLQNEGRQYYLELSLQHIEIDQPTDFPFNIPKNYSIR